MKKLIIVAALLSLSAPAHAFDIWGDHHHHKKPRGGEQIITVDPDRPVNPVPEPQTLLLLGAGMIALAAYGRKKR